MNEYFVTNTKVKAIHSAERDIFPLYIKNVTKTKALCKNKKNALSQTHISSYD
jgi:ribosomal protein S3AE